MTQRATARRGNVPNLELADVRPDSGPSPGGRTAARNRRAISLAAASDTASIRILWSGIRDKTLAATADTRGLRTSTIGEARSARSASTACASGRLTASSGGWSRSCGGGRGPDHAVRPEPYVRTRWSFCGDIKNLAPRTPAIPLLISSSCRAVHALPPPGAFATRDRHA
jgi:hypothetical protein